MFTFTQMCPHCATMCGFQTTALSFWDADDNWKHLGILARCTICFKSVCADTRVPDFLSPLYGNNAIIIRDLQEDTVPHPLSKITNREIRFLPLPPQTEVPDHLPEKVATKFRAAEKIYLSCRSDYNADLMDAAGNAYRAMLEAALALIDGGGDKNLNRRINALVESNRLTEEMGHFAHRIRSLGNQASHSELEFTRQELDDLRLFAKLFVLYLFTLPAMLPKD